MRTRLCFNLLWASLFSSLLSLCMCKKRTLKKFWQVYILFGWGNFWKKIPYINNPNPKKFQMVDKNIFKKSKGWKVKIYWFLSLMRTVLYSTVLYYTLLYSTILYCTLLYFTVLYCTLLYSIVLYSALLCLRVVCFPLYCVECQKCRGNLFIFLFKKA